jgi:hypothetical protein
MTIGEHLATISQGRHLSKKYKTTKEQLGNKNSCPAEFNI